MLLPRIKGKFQRLLANRCARRPLMLQLEQGIVSFTFDDFPRSALLEGGTILRSFGWHGTYFTSFGLMGTTAPTGEIFCARDLDEFKRQGHELACHTYDHCHSWDTAPAEFNRSIGRNQRAAADRFGSVGMSTFSYPISVPRPRTKAHVARAYRCARGGGQAFNSCVVDLAMLKGFFIEQSRDHLDRIKEVIDAAVAAHGWLILATHDVAPAPTRFGCTPTLFRSIVSHVAGSGASVLTVRDAIRVVQG